MGSMMLYILRAHQSPPHAALIPPASLPKRDLKLIIMNQTCFCNSVRLLSKRHVSAEGTFGGSELSF